MEKKIKNNKILIVIIVFFIVQALVVGFLAFSQNDLNKRLDSLNDSVFTISKNTAFATASINEAALRHPVVIDPQTNMVYIPEIKLSLPFNSITRNLQYIYDDNGDVRVSSSSLVSDTKTRPITCSELVRVNTQGRSAYSPWEKEYGTVELSNGQKLTIVAAQAFKNNEASTEDCRSEVWINITPEQVAAEFKNAKSY